MTSENKPPPKQTHEETNNLSSQENKATRVIQVNTIIITSATLQKETLAKTSSFKKR